MVPLNEALRFDPEGMPATARTRAYGLMMGVAVSLLRDDRRVHEHAAPGTPESDREDLFVAETDARHAVQAYVGLIAGACDSQAIGAVSDGEKARAGDSSGHG